MKKTLMTVLAIAIFVSMFGAVGSAYAMSDTGKGPGNGGNTGGGNSTAAAGDNSTSILSAYIVDAMASTLDLDIATLATRLDAGETFYDIALAEGYTAEEWTVLFASVQVDATEAALADGLTPKNQLNTNLGIQNRINDGTCDGTGDCTQDPVPNLYSGTNTGTRGRRGGR